MKILKFLSAAACFLFVFGILTMYGQKSDVSFTGVVEQIIIEGDPSRAEFFLISDSGNRYRLSDSKSLAVYTNRRVSLSGALGGDRLNIKGDIRVLDGKSGLTAPPPTFGSRKVLVLLVKFPDTPPLTLTPEIARTKIFTSELSPNEFVKEASQNRYRLTGSLRPDGDVTQWLTLPATPAGCDVYGQWTQSAGELARQNGFEPNNYNSVIYVFPHICNLRPSATVGPMGGTTTESIWLNEGTVYNEYTVTHELGHNLGLMHANGLSCQGNDFPNNCTSVEYGDVFDAMGSGVTFFFNNYSRSALGWLTGRAATVTESGDYRIIPPTATSKGIQILEIPLKNPDGTATGYSYFLEFRRPFSFDNRLTEPGYNFLYSGVGIRRAPSVFVARQGTDLIDATPQTPTHLDAPLQAGYTFFDKRHGVFIVSNGTNPHFGARVSVFFTR
ncbi:MAG TPA: hypothetical protein VIL74_21120 [Pyrinomonadaceae bacterium]|jgi:hypothetical protein